VRVENSVVVVKGDESSHEGVECPNCLHRWTITRDSSTKQDPKEAAEDMMTTGTDTDTETRMTRKRARWKRKRRRQEVVEAKPVKESTVTDGRTLWLEQRSNWKKSYANKAYI
jgi:hypothetical protein